MTTYSSPTNKIEIVPLIKRGWELFIPDIRIHIGFVLVISLLPTLFIPPHIWAIVTVVLPILEGSFLYALMRAFQKTPRFTHAFLIFNRALPLLLVRWATLIFVLLVSRGYILFVIPGLYLSVAYLLATPLVLDRNMRVWDTLELSRRVLTRQWFRAFLLMMAVALINVVGMIPAGLGLLITGPLTTCIVVALYESLLGVAGNFPLGDNEETTSPS